MQFINYKKEFLKRSSFLASRQIFLTTLSKSVLPRIPFPRATVSIVSNQRPHSQLVKFGNSLPKIRSFPFVGRAPVSFTRNAPCFQRFYSSLTREEKEEQRKVEIKEKKLLSKIRHFPRNLYQTISHGLMHYWTGTKLLGKDVRLASRFFGQLCLGKTLTRRERKLLRRVSTCENCFPQLDLRVLPVGPLQCNCTILVDEKQKEAVLIDLGGDVEIIKRQIEKVFPDTTVTTLLFTHGHVDHIYGAVDGKSQWPDAEIALPEEDLPLWTNFETEVKKFGLNTPGGLPSVDFLLNEGSLIPFGGTVLHTPGHTPGSSCFLFKKALDNDDLLIAGDTIFRGGFGRTDLWGGSMEKLIDSIKNKLLVLPPSTLVVPGHGDLTTIGYEKEYSPINYFD